MSTKHKPGKRWRWTAKWQQECDYNLSDRIHNLEILDAGTTELRKRIDALEQEPGNRHRMVVDINGRINSLEAWAAQWKKEFHDLDLGNRLVALEHRKPWWHFWK